MYVKCRLEVIKDYKCVWIGSLPSLGGRVLYEYSTLGRL